MRECIKCHEPKDESDFYQSPFFTNHICIECKLADGYERRCKRIARREMARQARIEKEWREVMG